VEAPHALIQANKAHNHLTQALIFANGDIYDGPMARQAIAEAQPGARIIAADGGARMAQHFGLHVDVIIGDMDSLTDDELQSFAAHGAELQRYPQEKNETDLELALQWAAR
jgi:thiamine pyrophosphokinase